MIEIKINIIKMIGVLSKPAKGWAKELNLISWNDREYILTSVIGRQMAGKCNITVEEKGKTGHER